MMMTQYRFKIDSPNPMAIINNDDFYIPSELNPYESRHPPTT